MKKIIVILLFVMFIITNLSWGANHFQQGFETTSAPTDWTDNAMYYNSTANHGTFIGNNGAGFNASDDWLYTTAVNSAGTLTFWIKGSSSPSQIGMKIQKSYNVSDWTDVHTYDEDTFGTTWTNASIDINDTNTTIYIRFYIHQRTGNSLYLDDIQLTDYSGAVDPEPTNHVTGFNVTADGYNKIDISWTENDGAQAPAGYLIKASTSNNVSDPSDGTAVSDNATIGSDSGAKNVNHGTTSYEWTELDAETQYYYKIYPYTNSGSDIDYKTDGTVPSGNATTDAEPAAPTSGDLYITEVCGDDVDGGSDNGFMEIYNNSDHSISLSNVQARYYNSNPGAPTQTVDLSGEIASGGYIIVTQDETNFNSTYTPVTADFIGSNFYFNGGDDGCDIYYVTNTTILDKFNGTSGTPWTWNDNSTWERSSTSDGAVKTNWTENTTGSGSPKAANAVSLPVTLSTFTAQYLAGKPLIYWTTQSETDNMGWFIYRNTIEDFTSSEKISGMIEGHGTTTQPQSYIYEDAEELQVEQTYYYWLESVDYSGTIHHYDRVAQVTIPHPNEPGQNVIPPVAYEISADPNPFSYTTNISFVMDQPSLVDVAIYNVKGQLVKSFNSAMTSQENETVTFSWNGKSDASKSLSNGVYLYSVKVNGKDYATKQLILMK